MQKLKNILPKIYHKGRWAYILPFLILGPDLVRPGYLFFVDFSWGPSVHVGWANSWQLLGMISNVLDPLLPAWLFQKILILGILALVVTAGRQLALCFTRHPYVIGMAGMFLLCNPFMYIRVMMGQLGTVIGLCCLIFFAVSLWKAVSALNPQSFFLPWIYAASVIFFSPYYIFGLALTAIFILALRWSVIRQLLAQPDSKKYLRVFFFGFLFCLALNSIWVTASIMQRTNLGSGFTVQDLYAFKPEGNSFAVLADTVTLRSFWIQGLYFKHLESLQFWLSFGVISVSIVLGVLLLVRRKEQRSKALLLIGGLGLSVFLALGLGTEVSAPTTLFLSSHVPFYIGLRDTSKWLAFTLAIYTLLFSIGLARFISFPFVRVFKVGFAILCTSILFFFSPYLFWQFGNVILPHQYPESWKNANTILTENNCFGGRTLVLPWHVYMNYSWLGTRAGNIGEKFFDCPLVSPTNIEQGSVSDSSGTEEGTLVPEWLATGNLRLLLNLGVTSIIIFHEVDWEKYQERMDALPYITQIKNIETKSGGVSVYRVASH
jgi:hypothetical protein